MPHNDVPFSVDTSGNPGAVMSQCPLGQGKELAEPSHQYSLGLGGNWLIDQERMGGLLCVLHSGTLGAVSKAEVENGDSVLKGLLMHRIDGSRAYKNRVPCI